MKEKKYYILGTCAYECICPLMESAGLQNQTSDSFGLGLGAIPMWIIFMLIFFVPQALMCAELATAYPTDGGLNDWVKIAFGTKYGFLVSWMHWTALIFWYASFLTFFSINFTYMIGKPDLQITKY